MIGKLMPDFDHFVVQLVFDTDYRLEIALPVSPDHSHDEAIHQMIAAIPLLGSGPLQVWDIHGVYHSIDLSRVIHWSARLGFDHPRITP